MQRFLRSILLLSVISALLGVSPPAPTRAASPIASGKWTGYFSRELTINNSVSGVSIKATANAKGDLTLKVDGNGGVSGTVGPYHAVVKWSASIGGVKGTCTIDFTWKVTSGKVSENAAHLPAFDLQLALTQSKIDCPTPLGNGPSVPKNAAHFEALTASGGKLTGEKIRFQTDQIDTILSNLAKVGAKTSVKEYWELKSSGASVDLIKPDFEQYFLAGVPFQNNYTALVDWHGNPPGKVDFALAGQTQEEPGDTDVTAPFDLGSAPAGKDPLQVTAIGADGQPSGSLSQDVIIVPLDGWAQKANFTAGETKWDGIQHVVIYHGKTSVPLKPIKLPYLDLPKIPVIGGKWGVPPFQVDVNLQANSGGGPSDPAPVSGKAALFLGGASPELSMKVDGQAVTNLTDSALLFDHGQANFSLAPYKLERNVGLVDLIPSAAALYKLPAVGKLLQGANSVLGIKLQLTAQAKGQGDLGVAADKSQLVFDKGNITPSVLVAAQPGLNIPSVISLGVGGGGKGQFTIRIAPKPGLKNCLVSLSFTAHVAVANLVNANYQSPPYQVAQCTPTAMGGRDVLVVYLPPNLSAQLRSAALAQDPQPQSAARIKTAENATDSVLVKGVTPQAALNLALGPQGQKALAYTSGDPKSGVNLRLFDGQAWGEDIPLGKAGAVGLSPAVAYDASGQVVAAWVQPKKSGTPSAADLESYARSWEIATAVVDSSGKIVKQDSLTNDDQPDFAPQLARAADGSLWLAWLESPAADLWGPKENPNRLLAARWDGKSWGKVETVSKEVTGALGFRLAAGAGGNVMAVASLDTDGNPQTSKDREIYAFQRSGSGWMAAQRITNDAQMDAFPLVAYTPEGQPVLAWQHGDTVVGLEGDLKGTPQTWKVGDQRQIPDLAGGELLAGTQGELALVWAGFTKGGQGVLLAQRPSATGDWQPAKPLVDGLDGAGQLSAKLAQDGGVWVGLAQLQVPTSAKTLKGLGKVSLSGLPTSADLAVVGAAGAMQALPQSSAASGGSAGPLGGSNLTKLLLIGLACLAALVVVGGGGVLVVRRLRR
ncbi:MAG: hypothetical protein P8Z00_12435 [Anaerolineales bacterium]